MPRSRVVNAPLVAQLVKNPLQCWRPGFDPWVGKILGEGKGYPLQYSGWEIPGTVTFTHSLRAVKGRGQGGRKKLI